MGILVNLTECRKARAKQTVLIADDDQVLLLMLDEFVKSEFPEMTRQLDYNGIEALDPLRLRTPSLLIIGMYMPGLTGAEVLKSIKTRRVDIPALMISGNVNGKEEAIKLSGYPANRLAFLRKPFKLEIFADTIRGLVSPWK